MLQRKGMQPARLHPFFYVLSLRLSGQRYLLETFMPPTM